MLLVYTAVAGLDFLNDSPWIVVKAGVRQALSFEVGDQKKIIMRSMVQGSFLISDVVASWLAR